MQHILKIKQSIMFEPKKIFFIIALVCVSFQCFSQGIIPQPTQLITSGGNFVFPVTPSMSGTSSLKMEVSDLSKYLLDEFKVKCSYTDSKKADIQFALIPADSIRLGKEGYTLVISKNGIQLKAPFSAGIFYGIQTLKQLLFKDMGKLQVPLVDVLDQPNFSWRAYMLDEGRYFQGKETVKAIIDEMALLKMNIFHWHLTEDQGWRLAIEKYPALTKIGAKRDSTEIGGWNSNKFDGKSHQGYYNKADIKEIINYAKAKHITIIPEIEMPGHSSAAIAAYPWLGVTKNRIAVPSSFGVKYDIFDVTDPKVIGFLHEVLDEVMALFPSNIVHIGGDEVKFKQWEESPSVKAFMNTHQLSSFADLHIYFTNGISKYLEQKGKRMMGWNDIMGGKIHDFSDSKPVTGKLAKEAIVQFWKGDLSMMKAAVENGYDIVNSYHEYTYLDYSYKAIPLSKAYGFNPMPVGLDPKYKSKILGLSCQMWGEWIPNSLALYSQTFPRLAAYAEVGWTALENKNFTRFNDNLNWFTKRWKEKKIMGILPN